MKSTLAKFLPLIMMFLLLVDFNPAVFESTGQVTMAGYEQEASMAEAHPQSYTSMP